MPVGPGRFRIKTTKSGKKVRLHFTPSGTVNEAKSLETSEVHTTADFKADKKRRKKKSKS